VEYRDGERRGEGGAGSVILALVVVKFCRVAG
jgi:hypothetical protein